MKLFLYSICFIILTIFNLSFETTDNISKLSLDELVKVSIGFAAEELSEEPTCAAGGCDATECSFSGEIMGVAVSNSVTCVNDTYACCHLTAYCFTSPDC